MGVKLGLVLREEHRLRAVWEQGTEGNVWIYKREKTA
jgi:hypothetical protein